jgi:hypothetical protein
MLPAAPVTATRIGCLLMVFDFSSGSREDVTLEVAAYFIKKLH